MSRNHPENNQYSLSRRAFLRGSVAVGAAVATAGVLAACGDNPIAPAATATAPIAQNVPPSPTTVAIVPPTDTPVQVVPPTNTAVIAASPTPTAAAAVTRTVSAADLQALRERPNVTVLCYHRIREWDADYNAGTKEATVLPKDFDEQMAYIKNKGYQIVLPDDMHRYFTDPSFNIPDQSVMITIDDGYLSAWNNALPVLEKYGLKAAWFPMMVIVDKENYVSSDNIRYLDKNGHTVGGHTYDHQNLTTLSGDENFKLQLVDAKKSLEDILGHPIKHFAYPWGGYNDTTIPRVRAAGYVTAYGLGDPRQNNDNLLYTIPRVQVFGGDNMDTFLQKLDHWLK